MKNILTILAALLVTATAFAGFRAFEGTTDLDIFNRLKCGDGITCSKSGRDLLMAVDSPLAVTGDITGDGGDQLVGFLVNQVVATATTITAAQCGSTFINGGAVQMELPEASTVLGCRVTFVTGNASNFDVNPDDADQILVETNAAGDAIRNATLGESVTIEAISASQWAVVAINGTYADID